MNTYIKYLKITVFLAILLTGGIAVGIYGFSYASTNSPITAFYNCEQYDQLKVTCYPSKTYVNGSRTTGTSQKIYTLSTKEADYSDGQYGKSLGLSAHLGEYITVNKSENYSFNNYSISFWVKRSPWFDLYAPILSFLNSNSTAGWIFDLQENGSSVRFGVANGSGLLTAPRTVQIDSDRYDNLVGTFNGSKISLYANGKLHDTIPYSGHYNAPEIKLRIGLESYYNINSWGGQIDDLRLYNRTLGSNEISALYHNASIANGLVGHWAFDENLNDTSASNNDATLRMQAVSMAFAPDGRMFFTEKRTGEIRIMKDDMIFDTPFAKVSGLQNGDHQGLLGITLDPKFEANHYVYVFITYEGKETHLPFNGVLRFTDNGSQGTNVTVLLDGIPADINGNYAGGALAFGTDDKLYITSGMGSDPANPKIYLHH